MGNNAVGGRDSTGTTIQSSSGRSKIGSHVNLVLHLPLAQAMWHHAHGMAYASTERLLQAQQSLAELQLAWKYSDIEPTAGY